MLKTKLISFAILVASLFGGIISCDTTSTNSENQEGSVGLEFETVTSSANKAAFESTASEHDSLILEGTNGTLRIDDVRFIVSEFELERGDDAVDDDSVEAEMEEFESKPFFVDLPLNDDVLSLANKDIPTGFYSELEFEVEDLDLEEDDEESEYQAIADSINAVYPDWPEAASMVITGSFTPTDSASQSFKVFAQAEIEIEREFEPPMEVTEDNVRKVVSVRIDPARWFEQSEGIVRDLTKDQWEEGQELMEFEAEFEDGTEEIEVENDYDDDDDDDDDND